MGEVALNGTDTALEPTKSLLPNDISIVTMHEVDSAVGESTSFESLAKFESCQRAKDAFEKPLTLRRCKNLQTTTI